MIPQIKAPCKQYTRLLKIRRYQYDEFVRSRGVASGLMHTVLRFTLQSTLHPGELTIEHVDIDTLGLCVRRVTLITSGVLRIGFLDEEEAGCGLSFLSDDAHSTSRRVVADYL